MRNWTSFCNKLRENLNSIWNLIESSSGQIYRYDNFIDLLDKKIRNQDILEETINILLDYGILDAWIDISCPICGEHLGKFRYRNEIMNKTLECIHGHVFRIDDNFFIEYEDYIEYLVKIDSSEGKKVLGEFLKDQRKCLISKKRLLVFFNKVIDVLEKTRDNMKKGRIFEDFFELYLRTLKNTSYQRGILTYQGRGDYDFLVDLSKNDEIIAKYRREYYVELKNKKSIDKNDILSFINKVKESRCESGIIVVSTKLAGTHKAELRGYNKRNELTLIYIEGKDILKYLKDQKYRKPEDLLNHAFRFNI